MTYILGINSFHADSSACIVQDGVLLAAAEEERFRRIKHWAGFPSEAIRYCLQETGIPLDRVDHVAINQDSEANLWPKITYALAKRPDIKLVVDRLKNKRKRASVSDCLAASFPGHEFKGLVHNVEHHLAHLASAYLVSPFDEAVVVSVDGFGDFASAAWGVGRGAELAVEDRIYFPHSLGVFYEAMTQYLGFPHYGDEYKVMGLAPYGKPLYVQQLERLVELNADGTFSLGLEYFRHPKEKVEYQWEGGTPTVGCLYTAALVGLLGPARSEGGPLTERHRDIASSVQAMYEKALFHLLNALYERYRIDSLAVAGGCGMNSVANGKVYRQTPFKRLYVQSAAGDAGGALGAAFAVWHSTRLALPGRSTGRNVMEHAYWGPQFEARAVKSLLDARRADLQAHACKVFEVADDAELCRLAAAAIAQGLVVGWFQGRMEWGPRALGNRSILADPRRSNMKDVLNLKIKRRESFRPFAPSVLREQVSAWFEVDDDVPFMMQVYPIRAEKRPLVPAVTHVDGSGRLQTVERGANPVYYRLIEEFHAISGVPMVLNTSFNENEPVVCKPEEALDCFVRTRMDMLCMGRWVVSR